MKFKYFYFVIVIAIHCMCSTPVSGQDSLRISETRETLESSETKTKEELYKLLYETEKDAGEKLLNTIHWIIGLSVGIIFTIIGLIYFFNYKLSKNEIELIVTEYENKIEKIREEQNRDIKSTLDHFISESGEIINCSLKDSINMSDVQLSEYFKDYEKRMENLKKEFDSETITKFKDLHRYLDRLFDMINDNKVLITMNQADILKIEKSFELSFKWYINIFRKLNGTDDASTMLAILRFESLLKVMTEIKKEDAEIFKKLVTEMKGKVTGKLPRLN